MAPVCTVCTHPKRLAINKALLDGTVMRVIAHEYALSEDALKRHKKNHLPASLAKAQAAKEIAQADDLLAQMKALRSKAMSLLMAAEKMGDYRTALVGIREARACIETLMEIESVLDRRPVVNIITSPVWVDLRASLLQALVPFPDARVAVAETIAEAERRYDA